MNLDDLLCVGVYDINNVPFHDRPQQTSYSRRRVAKQIISGTQGAIRPVTGFRYILFITSAGETADVGDVRNGCRKRHHDLPLAQGTGS